MQSRRAPPPAPEFFVDRSLGKSIAEALRGVGLTVHTMASVYGEKKGSGFPIECGCTTRESGDGWC